MAIPLKDLGIKSFSNVSSDTTGRKGATPLTELGIKSYPKQDITSTPQNQNVENKSQYDGENFGASFAKNIGASAVGSLPDMAIGLSNLTATSGRPTFDPVTGEEFPAHDPIESNITDRISNSIDKATSGYTKDTGSKSKHAARFLGSLFGTGYAGKAIQAVGAAGKLGKASEAVEKTGSFIAKNLGVDKLSTANVAGGTAAGTALGFAEEADIPVQYQIPLALGAFLLGQKGGEAASSSAKSIASKFKEIPALEKMINEGHFSDLAKNVDAESISELLKNSLIEKETEFLSDHTLSKLPKHIRWKIENAHGELTDFEVDLVVKEGLTDFNNKIKSLEKEYFPLTSGEFTNSKKIIAEEDALANRPNIDKFDKAMEERKRTISKRISKISNELSPENVSSDKIGTKIAKEVDSIYSDAEKIRSENWEKRFGNTVEQNIIPISNYQKKLNEFVKLRPDTEGNKVSIKAAKMRLNDGIAFEKKISPKRVNDILVGLNEEIKRFPDKTFSRKQMGDLKGALQEDLILASENAPTAEQASMVKEARAGYAEDSKFIDKLDESILFSKINKDSLQVPEKIAQALDTMPASQIKLTFDALKRSSNLEEVIPEIQKYYIEKAYDVATKNGVDQFNQRAFLNSLPKKEEFEVIFEGSHAYKEIKDISVLFKRMNRAAPSRSNSKTAQRMQADRGDLEEFAQNVSHVAKGNILSPFMAAVRKYTSTGRDNRVSDILLSPKSREEMLSQVGKTKEKYNSGIASQTILAKHKDKN